MHDGVGQMSGARCVDASVRGPWGTGPCLHQWSTAQLVSGPRPVNISPPHHGRQPAASSETRDTVAVMNIIGNKIIILLLSAFICGDFYVH